VTVAMVHPRERAPSRAVYVLIGVAVAVLLELLMGLASAHTTDLFGDAIHQAVGAAGRTLTHAEMANVKEQLRGWLLGETAARWLVFLCECGLAFWLGRKTAPRWGWGALIAAPRLVIGVAAALPMLQWSATWPYLTRASVWVALYAAAIAMAAFLGGSSRLRPRAQRAGDLTDDLNPDN
jgi:hypothetical protein